mgnify:CR=1 FL=1
MLKTDLRQKYKALRKTLSEQELEAFSLAIANKLLEMPIWEKSFYHVFLSIEALKEIDTAPILSVLSGKDKHIVVSKTHFKNRTLSHFLLTDSTAIKVNHWGIPEPTDGIEIQPKKIDVVFVPLLAFDKHGNRVGYGKGFYDKFLSECQPETLKIGLSFFESEEAIEGITENDVKLDFCVTPENVYRF